MLYIGILVYAIGWGVLLTFDRSTLETPWGTVPPQQIMNVVYFFIGAANMATYTAVVPLLSTVIEPTRRAAMFGINAAASTMVGFVGSLVGGSLPGVVAPILGVDATSEPAYRTAMYTVVVFGLLATVPLLGVSAHAKKQAQAASTTATTVEQPIASVPFTRILLLVTPSFFFGTAGGLFVPFQNLFFRQEFGMSDSMVGVNLALAALGMGIGSMIGGPLSVRLGVRRAAAWSRALAAPLTLMMLIPWLPVVAFSYDVNRLLVGLTFPLFSVLMMQTVPLHQRGTSTSMSSMSWSLGWAAASALSGTLQADGFTIVLILSAVSYVISGTLVAVLPYRDNLE
jgi:MFS family permease